MAMVTGPAAEQQYMEIKFNRTVNQSDWLTRFQTIHKEPRVDQPGVSFQQSVELENKLDQQPEIRPEAVERAKKLVRQADYPPAATINSIARLLASKFEEEQ